MPSKNAKFSQQAMQAINAQNAKNQKNGKSQKKVVKKVSQGPKSSDAQSAFYSALINPFDPSSLGCQVPDPFPFPTQTFHVHQTTVVGPPTSSSITSGGVAFLPNPVLSMIDLQHALSLTSLNVSIQNTPMTVYNTTGTSSSNCIYGAVRPSALSSVFSDYRVVSWGIKISNLQPELSATGRLMIAMVPLGDTIPSFNELSTATLSSVFTPIFGIDNTYLTSSNILELPTGFEVTVGDLLHGDLEIAGMYTSDNFWSFKTAIGSGVPGTGLTSGDSTTFNNTGGTLFTQGYKDLVRCGGGAAIVLYYEGIPNTANNAFQIETIYHLEGTPNFSSTANNALISSTARKAVIGTSNGVEQAMCKASKMTNAIQWIEKGANFLNKNSDTIFKIGGAAMALL